MGRKWITLLLLILLVLGVVQPVRAEVTAQQVRQSLERGVAFLKKQQDRVTGGWSEYPGFPGGLSALCTLALLNAGEDPQNPEMQRALAYQRAIEPEMTYSVALQTMVFCAAEPEKDRLLIRRNVQWLQSVQITSGDRNGAWKYSGGKGFGDNSNTQFALLALHEAERVGVEVDDATWRRSLDYWRRTQHADGAWSYVEDNSPTGSMTCAGIASLVICQGQISAGDAQVVSGQVHCCGQQQDDDALERALQWMGRKFTVHTNPSVGESGSNGWLLYYLYGVERVGRLTGRRFIGDHDWYREGAEKLVTMQDQLSGYWIGSGHQENNPLVATSFALLFLSKGMRPIVVSKLRHGQGNDWDNHRQAIHHLTQRVERNWKRYLTWQTIDAKSASVEDLLQSPVLFISGREALQLDAEQKENLRRYVMGGGFIFAEAAHGHGCDGTAFDESFRQLMSELFPQSPLRLLPPDHPVWYAEQKVDSQHLRPLYGIEACCRTSVVYCPRTLSCFWELGTAERTVDHPPEVEEEIESVLRIGANVIAYATNRQLKDKLDRPRLLADQKGPETSRGTLAIAKLDHNGGSDDVPHALSNLLDVLHHEVGLPVDLQSRLVSPADPQLYEHPLVFLHGRSEFQFTAEERAALKDYLERGGFIFGDAICASPQFANAFRRQFEAIAEGAKFQRIAVEHPLFSGRFRGFDLPTVTLRDPQVRAGGTDRLDVKLNHTSPLLEGLEIDGRLAVVFSPYDISCALEHHASLECKGYTTEDAQRIGINIILYALQQ